MSDCLRDGFVPGTPLDNERFTTLTPLNHGSFGMVLAAKDSRTGNDVAIKCITKPNATSATFNCPAAFAVDDHSEELAIHSRLATHPNIVNLLHHFETKNHQYMVLELCSNGDLYEAIRLGKGPLETERVREFMLELVSAIDYLHSNGVYHRDIKPENIFLTNNGSMKLGDFGLATSEIWSTEFAVGSDRYMAPEQYDSSVYGHGYSPALADVWAIGIVLLNVLFQRNPFMTPTLKDPLFADFSRDRQSLFDVFPNMSQDTFEVLAHCMVVDPEYRSLAAVRDALKSAVSFTVDDESLDDFCVDSTELGPGASMAREPLRTPSISSPAMGNNDSFPWPSALLKSPPKPTRQLSTIHDEEQDLFPESFGSHWHYIDADEASLASNVDSGLGMSYKSSKSGKSVAISLPAKSKPSTVGSLPISFTRPSLKSAPYSMSGFSKSWSDLYDEEVLDEEEDSFDVPVVADVASSVPAVSGPETPRALLLDEDEGSLTPRPAPVDAVVKVDEGVAFVEAPKPRSMFDKWAALGNFRRSRPEAAPVAPAPPRATVTTALAAPPRATVTPARTKYSEAFASFTSFSTSKKAKPVPQTRERAPSWRQQGSPQRLRAISANDSKIWQQDDNWREHKPPVAMMKSSPSPPTSSFVPRSHSGPRRRNHNFLDDDSDQLEWTVGGWRNLHL